MEINSRLIRKIKFIYGDEEYMKDINFSNIIERSIKIRENYHKLENQYHGKEWTVEEDALAFLTDAGLVGRLTMAQQNRWPQGGDTVDDLEHKLSECIWWLIVLADRMDIDISTSLDDFLSKLQN
ncbi:MazG-like protein [Clostridium akagii]|uniref:MazG-like protein n=1 Tax=Clostridium akagii TaxID=91623 RepID=UPI001FA782E8|nr:MazG-like protein [Clostridium akagii]